MALESAFNDTYKLVRGHQECLCFWSFPWIVGECMYVRETHTLRHTHGVRDCVYVRERHTRERDRETHTHTVRECMYVREWETRSTHTHTSFWLFPVISLVSLFLPSPSPLHRCPPQLLTCQPPLPETLNFPAEPSLLEVPSSSHLIGLHLPHQPHLHVDNLLTCLGSDHLP